MPLKISRRKFIKISSLAGAGLALNACKDFGSNPLDYNTPGRLAPILNPQKVIVVGAGISGLVAAYELVRAGHNVEILEARNRIGGRVMTLRNNFSGGIIAEAGASRIPPNHNLTHAYIEHFGLKLTTFYPEAGEFVDFSEGVRTKIPAEEYLNNTPWPGASRHRDYQKIINGMDQLPKAFGEKLIGRIHFNSTVIKIRQNEKNVTVLCADGKKLEAERLICTLPLTVLYEVKFSPGLGLSHQLIQRDGYNYTPSSRIYIESKSRFWENENLNGWGKSDYPEEIWQPSWDVDKTEGVLQSYLRYQKSLDADTANSKTRNLIIKNRWEEVFPGLGKNIKNITYHSWNTDEFSKGAYAAPTNHQATLTNLLAEQEGRIHFAGEHLSDYHGWIQGALQSGIRVAKEVHTTALA